MKKTSANEKKNTALDLESRGSWPRAASFILGLVPPMVLLVLYLGTCGVSKHSKVAWWIWRILMYTPEIQHGTLEMMI